MDAEIRLQSDGVAGGRYKKLNFSLKALYGLKNDVIRTFIVSIG